MQHIVSREDLIKNLINEWLSMPGTSCANCGDYYLGDGELCCEKPFIASNKEIFRQFVKENQMIRDSQLNKFASTQDKSMRLTLSMPAGLLGYLQTSFPLQANGEKLFNEEYDSRWFAKHFGKYFQVPEEI